MRKSTIHMCVLILLVGAGVVCGGTKAYCSDEWYADVGGHWAIKYIRTLWYEGVTDGERSEWGKHRYYYYPDDNVTRGQLATLLSKVFQLPPACPENPSYPDVPKDYCIYIGKPAWEFIEGTLAGGLVYVAAGSRFYPNRFVSREDAVEFLIRSLDLERYVMKLTPDEVTTILRRFWDWEKVTPSRRAAMALAIRLGIIDGYEDWSLKPMRNMSRAEAVTVVCRSCLIRVSARGDRFSPDGDGVDEIMGFDVAYLKNRGIRQWQVVIASDTGEPVYHFNWDSESGQPPLYIEWDGRDFSGVLVPGGQYYYNGWIEDSKGRVFSSVVKPLFVDIHSISARLDPVRCVDGRKLTIWAQTTPRADRVSASFETGKSLSLATSDGGYSWQAQFVMGPPIKMGSQHSIVTATFPEATRSTSLYFERVEDLWLSASVEPNPTSWGQTLLLSCRTPPAVRQVSVRLFGANSVLSNQGHGEWTGKTTVAWNLQPGIYPAVFTGATNEREISTSVMVDVRSPETAELIYILSK